jgi:hypothetical protein
MNPPPPVRPIQVSEMSLRDYFAAHAMKAILKDRNALARHTVNKNLIAATSYEFAGAMLEARKK